MRILRLALIASLALLSACKDEPRYTASSESAAVDRARLCADGGATLNQTSNECVCPAGMSWSGIRCDAPPPPAPAIPEGVPPHDPEVDKPETAEATPAPVATAEADFATRLKTACVRAKGTWLEKDLYCHCPDDKVLVARRCRALNGNVTDDACLRSVNKGRWNRGVCECEPGLVFSPSRGGCVAKFTGEVAVLRRVCESTMNKGKWDAMNTSCRCPEGRVWSDELCQVRNHMTSRAICESDANRGKWRADSKQCACAPGFFWMNQSCQKLTAVTAKAACESETNGGRWQDPGDRCICPGLTHWLSDQKTCVGH